MQSFWHQFPAFLTYYRTAKTRFQVHSPRFFDLANAVLEDQREYYAFRDIEAIRLKMLASPVTIDLEDYGASDGATPVLRRDVPVRQLARQAASSPRQGRALFRLAQLLRPARMLELGTSVGVGAMYLATGARQARFITLEGSETCAQVARVNLDLLGLGQNVRVKTGPFRETLPQALQALGAVDLVFVDGHHNGDAALQYFEQCLPYAHEQTVLVFDDLYWSTGMTGAWRQIQQHPRVTGTIDFFDLGLVLLDPGIREKQHFCLAPVRWKPWLALHIL